MNHYAERCGNKISDRQNDGRKDGRIDNPSLPTSVSKWHYFNAYTRLLGFQEIVFAEKKIRTFDRLKFETRQNSQVPKICKGRKLTVLFHQ